MHAGLYFLIFLLCSIRLSIVKRRNVLSQYKLLLVGANKRHHAPLPNKGQEKATLTKSTVVCVTFQPGNWRIDFILKTTKQLFGRSAWQQPCHRRPKRKSRPKLGIFLLVMYLCYCYRYCCRCFSFGKSSGSIHQCAPFSSGKCGL